MSYKSPMIGIGDMMQQWRACNLGCETHEGGVVYRTVGYHT